MIRTACIRSGALFNPWLCPRLCKHFTVTGLHHCELLLTDIAVRAGGLTRTETATLLGWPAQRVKDVEETALRKGTKKLRRLHMVAVSP